MAKNKVKTKKSAAKRFKVTASGKLMRRRSFTGHLSTKRSKKTKRKLARSVEFKGSFAKKLKKVMGVRTRRRKNGKN